MLRTAVQRASSSGPESATPQALATIIEWQATAIAEKLKAVSPPKWKTRQQLHDDAMLERYGPGTYMGRLTPTPGFTPTPSPPPQKQGGEVQTPLPSSTAQLSSPFPLPPNRRNHEHIPKTRMRMDRSGRSKRPPRALKSPNANRVEKRSGRNSRHPMVTRSQCRGSCCRR